MYPFEGRQTLQNVYLHQHPMNLCRRHLHKVVFLFHRLVVYPNRRHDNQMNNPREWERLSQEFLSLDNWVEDRIWRVKEASK